MQQLEDGSVDPETVLFDFTGIPQGADLPELTAALEEIIAKYPSTCFVSAWLAGHYAQTHQCDQLSRLAHNTLQYCSRNSLALADIGQAYGECQDVIQSEQFLKRAIAVNPDSGARSNLARLYGISGRNDLCVDEAREYIRRQRGHVGQNPGVRTPLLQAYNILGVCLVQLGKADEALQWFEEALQLAPQDPLIRDNYEWAKGQTR